MFLPKKEETLAEFFPSFPKFSSNLEHFEKKNDDAHSLCIFVITDYKKRD